MKKTLFLAVTCIILLCACGTKAQQEQPASPTVTSTYVPTATPTITSIPSLTPTEVPKSSLEILRDTLEEENALCGVAFLSYFEGEYADAMTEWETAGLFARYPFLQDITEQQIILTGGGEWYLLVPTKDTAFYVYESFIDYEDFILKPGKELYSDNTGAPILIRGNVSDIYPSTVVVLEKDDRRIEYSPYLSLKDGSLAEGEGIYVIGQ